MSDSNGDIQAVKFLEYASSIGWYKPSAKRLLKNSIRVWKLVVEAGGEVAKLVLQFLLFPVTPYIDWNYENYIRREHAKRRLHINGRMMRRRQGSPPDLF